LIEHGLTAASTQYRLYGWWFLQVKIPNPTVSKYWKKCYKRQIKQWKQQNAHMHRQLHKKGYTQNKHNKCYTTLTILVYTNMGWLGDSSHRGQVCQAWTAVGLPPRYPLS